jgi:hypothetical protein
MMGEALQFHPEYIEVTEIRVGRKHEVTAIHKPTGISVMKGRHLLPGHTEAVLGDAGESRRGEERGERGEGGVRRAQRDPQSSW